MEWSIYKTSTPNFVDVMKTTKVIYTEESHNEISPKNFSTQKYFCIQKCGNENYAILLPLSILSIGNKLGGRK